jgi:hypothetical protein
MISLTYVSTAVEPFTPADLTALLAGCRERNARAGVTGMLLYKDRNFMQVLEGEPDAVRGVHARIERDPRHRGLLTLLQESVDAPQFPDWSMGFRDLESDEVRAMPGYSDFLRTPLTGAEFVADPTRSQKLLLSFKKNMR